MQSDSSLLCLLEEFGAVITPQNQKPIFILIIALQGVIAAEAMVQEDTHPIGNECRINTENISSGCEVGWQEEKEWNVNNSPIAILEKGKPLNCIEPCIKLQDQEIWLNCTAINYTSVKYTYRCTKNNQVEEFTIYFNSTFLSKADSRRQIPKMEGRDYRSTAMSIGLSSSLIILLICLHCMVNPPNLHIFGHLEETGTPRGKPRRYGENMKTSYLELKGPFA